MSFIGKPGVAYGLQKKTISKPIGIFANADDDEEETGPIDARARTNLSIARAQAAQKKAVDKVVQQAMKEDANAFAYDEIYNDLQTNRQKQEESQAADRQKRESKYISNLLKTAEERKRENEILYERKLMKERQAEDDQFGDKPKYVTGAYKEKLKERQLWLEEQKRLEATEAAQSVTKQSADSAFRSFYSNLLDRKSTEPSNSSTTGSADPQTKSSEPISSKSTSSASSSKSDSSSKSASISSTASTASSPSESKKRAHDDARSSSQSPPPAPSSKDDEDSERDDKKPRLATAASPPAPVAAPVDPAQAQKEKESKVLCARERYLQRKQQQKAAEEAAASNPPTV